MKLGLRQEFSYKRLAFDFALGFATSGLSSLAKTAKLGELGVEAAVHSQQMTEAFEAGTKATRLLANSAQGSRAEQEAVNLLVSAKEHVIIGQRMHMIGEEGESIFVDIMSRDKSGQIFLHEVKSGGALLSEGQDSMFIDKGVDYFSFSGKKTMEKLDRAVESGLIFEESLLRMKRSLIGIMD